MVIDDAISEKSVDESGDASSLKKNDDDGNSSQNGGVEKQSSEKETTIISRRETRSFQVPSSLLTPLEVQPPIFHDDQPSISKKPLLRVRLNHPKSNIIGDLDEGLRLRRGPSYSVNDVTYHCYLAQFEPKKVEEALQDENWVDFMH